MIRIQAVLFKVQTTVDGGWRISLDASQNDSAQILQLSQLRDCLLNVTVEPDGIQTVADNWDIDPKEVSFG